MRKKIKYCALIASSLLLLLQLGCTLSESEYDRITGNTDDTSDTEDSRDTGGAGKEFDPENDIQDVVFEDYGSQTLGEAAEDMMTNIQWSAQLDPEGDGLMDYLAKLTGTDPVDNVPVEMNFKLTYLYRQTRDDPLEYEAELISVTVDGESYDNIEDLDLMLSWIYGHDLEEEYGDYYEEQVEPDNLETPQQGGTDDVTFITLEELDDAFYENSIAFEQTYLNKYYYVEGEISSITTTLDDFPVIQLSERTPNNYSYAHFYFNDFPQEIYDLKVGDHVTLMGCLESYVSFYDSSIYSIE